VGLGVDGGGRQPLPRLHQPVGRAVHGGESPLTIHPLCHALARLAQQPRVQILQIGAYVGPSPNDPLAPFLRKKAGPALTAVLVEPVRDYFDRLVENYKGLEGVWFENAAVADSMGEREFYRLGAEPTDYGLPAWLKQLGSLRADRVTELWDRCEAKENHPELQAFWLRHRKVETVKCTTLSRLIGWYGLDDLDLLQIDAEGDDFEILRTLDFSKVKPRYVNYERVLLGDSEARCRRMLENVGYRITDFHQDTFAERL
jgi:FkbM family methyltransferase